MAAEIDVTTVRFNGALGIGDDTSLSEWVYANLDPAVLSEYGITEDQINRVLEKSNLMSFVADKLDDIIGDVYQNDRSAEITSDELVDLIRDNSDVIEKNLGLQLTENDYDKFEDSLDSSNDFAEISDGLRPDKALINGLHWASSYYLFALLLVLAAGFLFLTLLINRYDIRRVPRLYGVTAAAVGAFYLIAGVLVTPVGKTIASQLSVDVFLPVLPQLRLDFLKYGAIIAGIGVILIILGRALRKLHPESIDIRRIKKPA
jgi:hypothetical protein